MAEQVEAKAVFAAVVVGDREGGCVGDAQEIGVGWGDADGDRLVALDACVIDRHCRDRDAGLAVGNRDAAGESAIVRAWRGRAAEVVVDDEVARCVGPLYVEPQRALIAFGGVVAVGADHHLGQG